LTRSRDGKPSKYVKSRQNRSRDIKGRSRVTPVIGRRQQSQVLKIVRAESPPVSPLAAPASIDVRMLTNQAAR
jgi:hypothetical protein